MFKDVLLNTDLYNKKVACKYLLKAIEDSTNDDSVNKEKLDVSSFSIEHIMPQKLTQFWIDELGDNYEKVHEKYLHSLGNLTLIGYNSELGNKTFEDKKHSIEEKNSHIVVLNKDVLDQKTWNENTIKARAERLSSIIQKLFYIEKSSSVNAKNNDYANKKISLQDDFNPTGTKPKTCIMCGESILVDSYADMLAKVIDMLYDLDDDILEDLADSNYILPGAKKVYITKSENLLRREAEVYESGIFYETNLSATNILSFIRGLFDKYDLDYIDLIFTI